MEEQSMGSGAYFSLDITPAKYAGVVRMYKAMKEAYSVYEIYDKMQEFREIANAVFRKAPVHYKPILAVNGLGTAGLSAGVMGSAGGLVDVRELWGPGGYLPNL